MVTKDCKAVEFFLAPGCFADVDGLKIFNFDLPEGSVVYGGKAYNDYKGTTCLCRFYSTSLSKDDRNCWEYD